MEDVTDSRVHAPVPVASISIHGGRIACGYEDGKVRVYNEKKNIMYELEHTDKKLLKDEDKDETRVWSVAFNSDGKKIASGGKDKTIKIWNMESVTVEKAEKTLNDTTEVLSVAFNKAGDKIVSGGKDGTIKIWDLKEKDNHHTVVDERHAGRVNSVRFSPDVLSTRFASGSEDGTVKLWDSKTNRCLATFQGYNGDFERGVWSVAFSPDSKLLASGSGGKVKKVKKEEEEEDTEIKACVRVWDLLRVEPLQPSSTEAAASSLTPQATLEPDHEYVLSPEQSVHSVAFNNDNIVAAGLHDGGILIANPKQSGIGRIHNGYVNSVAYLHPNVLVSGGQDGFTITDDLFTVVRPSDDVTYMKLSDGVTDVKLSGGGSRKTKLNKKTKRKTKKNRK